MKKSLFLALFLWVSNVLGYEIIIDETIGLRFQRDNAKQVVIDTHKHLMWQDDASVQITARDWNGAIEYCKSLNFAGFGDWRLPTRMELLSITDKKKLGLSIKNGFVNITENDYWSSSPNVSDSSYAWYVSFNSGDGIYGNNDNNRLIRCVRGSR